MKATLLVWLLMKANFAFADSTVTVGIVTVTETATTTTTPCKTTTNANGEVVTVPIAEGVTPPAIANPVGASPIEKSTPVINEAPLPLVPSPPKSTRWMSTQRPSGTPAVLSCGPTPAPPQPSMVPNCNRYYFVPKGAGCDKIAQTHGILEADIIGWNPHAGFGCTMLLADYWACIGTGTCATTLVPPTTQVAAQTPITPATSPFQTTPVSAIDTTTTSILSSPTSLPMSSSAASSSREDVADTIVPPLVVTSGPAPAPSAVHPSEMSSLSLFTYSPAVTSRQQDEIHPTLPPPPAAISGPPLSSSTVRSPPLSSPRPHESAAAITSPQDVETYSSVPTPLAGSAAGLSSAPVQSPSPSSNAPSASSLAGSSSRQGQTGTTFSPLGISSGLGLSSLSVSSPGVSSRPQSGVSTSTTNVSSDSISPSESHITMATSPTTPRSVVSSSSTTVFSSGTPSQSLMSMATLTPTPLPLASSTSTTSLIPGPSSPRESSVPVPTAHQSSTPVASSPSSKSLSLSAPSGSSVSTANSLPTPFPVSFTTTEPAAPSPSSSSEDADPPVPPPILPSVTSPPGPDTPKSDPCVPCPPKGVLRTACVAALGLVGKKACPAVDINFPEPHWPFGNDFPLPIIFPPPPMIIPDPFHPPHGGQGDAPDPIDPSDPRPPPPGTNPTNPTPIINNSPSPTRPDCTDKTAAITTMGCYINGTSTTCAPYGTQTITGCYASNVVTTNFCSMTTVTDQVVFCANVNEGQVCTTTSTVSQLVKSGCDLIPMTITHFPEPTSSTSSSSSSCSERTGTITTVSCFTGVATGKTTTSCRSVGTSTWIGCSAQNSITSKFCSASTVTAATVFCASGTSGSCSSTSTISTSLISGCDVTASTTTTYAPACPAQITASPDDDQGEAGDMDIDEFLPPIEPYDNLRCETQSNLKMDYALNDYDYIYLRFCWSAGTTGNPGFAVTSDGVSRWIWTSQYTYQNVTFTSPAKIVEFVVATDSYKTGDNPPQIEQDWCSKAFKYLLQECYGVKGTEIGWTKGGCWHEKSSNKGVCVKLYELMDGDAPPSLGDTMQTSPLPFIGPASTSPPEVVVQKSSTKTSISSQKASTTTTTKPKPPPPPPPPSSPQPGKRPPYTEAAFMVYKFEYCYNHKSSNWFEQMFQVKTKRCIHEYMAFSAPKDNWDVLKRCSWLLNHHGDRDVFRERFEKREINFPQPIDAQQKCNLDAGFWDEIPALDTLRLPMKCEGETKMPHLGDLKDCIVWSRMEDPMNEEVYVKNTGVNDGIYLQCSTEMACCEPVEHTDGEIECMHEPNMDKYNIYRDGRDQKNFGVTKWLYKSRLRCDKTLCDRKAPPAIRSPKGSQDPKETKDDGTASPLDVTFLPPDRRGILDEEI